MIPVLEVGGTHVSAALVDPAGWSVRAAQRFPLDADGTADTLIAAFVTAARSVDAPSDATWGVAMPDPFDYPTGVALFDAAVAKFGALHGIDVRSRLRAELGGDFMFLNDAGRTGWRRSRWAPALVRGGSSTARSSIRATRQADVFTARSSSTSRSRT